MKHNNEPVCRLCGFTARYCDCQKPNFEEYAGQMEEEEKDSSSEQSLADTILNGEEGTNKADNP